MPPKRRIPEHGHVGVNGIAAMFGVTRQAVLLWTADPNFPEPIYRAPKHLVWHLLDIETWATVHRPQ